MRDPITSKIPTEAFCWPDTQKLSIGELSLASDDRVGAARSLLQCLDLDTMLEELRGGWKHRSCSGMSHNLDGPYTVKPISVSINGIEPLRYPQGSSRVHASIIDTESIFSGFVQGIRRRFVEAGLMKLTQGRSVNTKIPLHMALVDTKRIFTTSAKEKPHLLKYMPENKVIYQILRLNLPDLYTKYKDFVWASDVQLEKLSICELGLYEFMRGPLVVGQGHREIASVALPGATQPELSAVMEDITYRRVKRKSGVDPNAVYDVNSR